MADPHCISLGKQYAKQLYPNALPAKLANSWPHHERYDPPVDLDFLDSIVQCKAMPGDETKLIMALPVVPMWEATDQAQYEPPCCDLDVLILTKDTGKLIARMHEDLPLSDWKVDGFTIDTARYDLASNNRAFGVRIDYSPSSAHHYVDSPQSLSLYLAQGNSIQRVLDLLEVAHSAGEPSFEDDVCEPDTQYMQRTISMASTTANRYSDLIVHERRSVVATGGDTRTLQCDTKKTETKKQFTLHFDGSQYVIPKPLRIFATPNQ